MPPREERWTSTCASVGSNRRNSVVFPLPSVYTGACSSSRSWSSPSTFSNRIAAARRCSSIVGAYGTSPRNTYAQHGRRIAPAADIAAHVGGGVCVASGSRLLGAAATPAVRLMDDFEFELGVAAEEAKPSPAITAAPAGAAAVYLPPVQQLEALPERERFSTGPTGRPERGRVDLVHRNLGFFPSARACPRSPSAARGPPLRPDGRGGQPHAGAARSRVGRGRRRRRRGCASGVRGALRTHAHGHDLGGRLHGAQGRCPERAPGDGAAAACQRRSGEQGGRT